MNFNVIGDIAGNYKTLLALLDKMPKDAELISLGDPNDRGPDSKSVIEYLMTHGRTVNSNHAHMLVEEWKQQAMPGAYPRYYDSSIFFANGGLATLNSYRSPNAHTPTYGIPGAVSKEHIKWLEECPMYIETDQYAFTHAPLRYGLSLEEASNLGDGFVEWRDKGTESHDSLLWNRHVPDKSNPKLPNKVNIFGHNSSTHVKIYGTKYPLGLKVTPENFKQELDQIGTCWGIALDTSNANVLTGLHIPSMTLYQQDYING